MREDSLLNPTIEDAVESSLRPRRLEELIGPEKVKNRLRISLEAAVKEGRALDHILLSAPPGLGKTTLAAIIAAEMGVQFRLTPGPALERPGDLAAILSHLDSRDVCFIGASHRRPRAVGEVLYPAMQHFLLDVVLAKG